MKLIFCPICNDVKKLQSYPTYCECRKSYGRYINSLDAEIFGEAIPIGFSNPLFYNAIRNQPEVGLGKTFEAFVIPKNCDTIKVHKEEFWEDIEGKKLSKDLELDK